MRKRAGPGVLILVRHGGVGFVPPKELADCGDEFLSVRQWIREIAAFGWIRPGS
jgi:hypothetical protein